MLIWGWRTRTKTLSNGIFFSPQAGCDAPYELLEARRWFTLFFIPLIPLSVLGTFVRCGLTGAEYDAKILEAPTNSDVLGQLVLGSREMVATAAMAGGFVSDAKRRLAVDAVRSHVGDYDDAQLEQDLRGAAQAPLTDRLRYLSGTISQTGKERLLLSAAALITADGTADAAADQSVRWMGEQLLLSPAHVHGIIAQATAPVT